MKDSTYFSSLGYKWLNSQSDFIIKDFQRHAGIESDGKIGPITKAKMDYYNHANFCPEVFEPIKPYIPYSDDEIESLMQPNLIGYGYIFNSESKKNNFDVLHNIGHAVLEGSEKGKWANSYIARIKNNIYGFGAYDLSPVASAKKFENLKEGMEIWSKWFNENYLEAWGQFYHGNCEKGVNFKYASSGIAGINKSFIVRKLRNKLY
jgi:beta-N-acetylglucosaminidase